MNVAICDDVLLCRSQIRQFLDFYAIEREVNFEYFEFVNGEELLTSKEEFELIFLDIELEGINGISVAGKLKNKNCKSIIFVVTAFNRYLDDAMDLNVFRYIEKPIEKDRLFSGVDKAIKLLKDNTIFVTTKENDSIKIFSNDIVCIEIARRYVKVTTVDSTYLVREKMDFFKDKLENSDFLSPHNSYLVNLQYVEDFNAGNIRLKSGKSLIDIPIAQKKQAEIRRILFTYFKEQH